ncbi:MAG TPA: hypothetical protein PLV93_04370 [Microthrixaceae bacterium]|nr:hypothetical protein [Microthrixaceae bacterium]HNI34607.1 hypothetical protein [Microthrixaceae bacterium]
MTPADAADAVARPIGSIGSRFMFDPGTYADAAALGYSGLDFYFAGRCGVLGDTSSDVVNAALGFFEPDTVATLWRQGCAVEGATAAAQRFNNACAAWGEAHFGDGVDYHELGMLADRVIAAAPSAALPIFAGWRAMPLAPGPKGSVCQRLNVLRELRGGAHLVSVVASGVSPYEAVLAQGGIPNAELFGFTAPHPDTHHLDSTMAEIEVRTTRIVEPAFAALTDSERGRFVDLVRATRAGLV